MENSGKKKIYCLALVAIATSWSSRRSGESEFCGKVMNLASTGTEMDFLSQPVNQLQETNMQEVFWNALYLLLMYEKCIKISSRGFVFQGLPFLSVQTNALKDILNEADVCNWDKDKKSLAVFSATPWSQQAPSSSKKAALIHSLQCTKVSKVSLELHASSCPSQLLRRFSGGFLMQTCDTGEQRKWTSRHQVNTATCTCNWSALKTLVKDGCLVRGAASGHPSYQGKGGMKSGRWAGVSWPLPAERLHVAPGCPRTVSSLKRTLGEWCPCVS